MSGSDGDEEFPALESVLDFLVICEEDEGGEEENEYGTC